MYNQELEDLISAALADGILTDKERQILCRKAQSMGVDLDEFQMVLDARCLEHERGRQASAASNKFGNVRKCPNCGATIGSFQMTCPECGFEFSGVGPNKFVEKFSSELKKVYDKPLRHRALVKAESNFVKSYPLPMTMEDCIEMLNFILPKTHLSGSNGATKAWRNKFFAILSKLELENPTNPKVQQQVGFYKQQAKMSAFGKVVIWYKGLAGFVKFLLWFFLFNAVIICIDEITPNRSKEKENTEIEQVTNLINAGDIEGAKLEVSKGKNSKPLYDYYMNNKMWEEAEELIPKKYSEVTDEAYFDYCKKAVTAMCQDGELEQARKFIKRKVTFYMKNDSKDPDSNDYKEWNTEVVSEKLNAIVDNF